ncbi:8085_t:CDS:2, partial [Cetraspora pellucida]
MSRDIILYLRFLLKHYFMDDTQIRMEENELRPACSNLQPNINDVKKSLKDWNIRTGALEDHWKSVEENYRSKFLSSLQSTSSAIESSTIFVLEYIILEGEENFDGSNNERQRIYLRHR